MTALVAKATTLPGVIGAVSPYDSKAISQDGRYALVTVQFQETSDVLTPEQRTAYQEARGRCAHGLDHRRGR